MSHGETGVVEERVTYADLDARARAIGASLQAAGAGGERVVLLLPPGPDFVASFFGCLYAGAVAVPSLPPRRRGADPRLAAICRDARPRVALTTDAQLPALESAAAEIPELAAALRMAPTSEAGADWRRPDLGPEALAFLQYTSGSTSTPKGVMVSHGNLLHNEELIRRTFAQSSESVVLGWLPLYHDMGLIGTVLQPLYTGAVCYLMTPGAFLQRPARWLEAISRYRATTSGGPNFAYELCVRKVGEAEREGLDLSSWQVAFNGAEPVRAGTLRRFAEAFAPCGFRAEAFRPCYGLAEATLLVSGWRQEGETRVGAFDAEALERHETADAGEAGEGARSRELVSCGAAMQTVLAVGPESGEPCAPGRVGEIWVAGPSVAQGYWQRPEETAATFGARLADGTGPFLRTGDLGFVSEGEVFLTGRLKDLIILRGRNHYPQDLELTAERSHAGLRAGGGAAFAVDVAGGAGEERLVIVHEVERHARFDAEGEGTEEIAAAVRRAVAEEHEVSVAEVVLIRPETLPRTSSGKVRRSTCRDLYLQGGLRVIGASHLAPAAVDEDPSVEVPVGSHDWLRRVFAAAARIDPARVDADLPLAASGLDSLAAVELKQTVEEATGVSVSLMDLLEGMTLRELEGALTPRPPLPGRGRGVAGEGMGVRARGDGGKGAAGEHPLSWNQRSLWFLHRLAPESSAYNIAGAARLEAISSEALGRALEALVRRHPMLRATFADTPGGPVQRLPEITERGEAALEAVDATGWSDAEVHARLHAEAYRPFDLAAGPLLRVVLLRRDDRGGEAFLAFAVHHVAADFWSMAVLVRELGALVAGETLPPPVALYTDFAHWQERMLESPAGEWLWEHWRERLAGTPQLDLPTDRPRRPVQSLRGGARTLPPSLERAEAVQRLAATHGCTPFVALLAAWQIVLSRWSGQEEFLTGAPMAGRSAREWGEVVGYFVNLVPLRANLSGALRVRELMARTRGTVLDALAHQDLPFALLTERLQPERDPSRPPLVAAMLTFEKAPAPELAALAAFAVGVPGVRLGLGGLGVLETLPLAPPAAQLDLSLTAAELPAGLAVSLQWDADLFDAATIDRLMGHFDRLLSEMATADRPVAELPLLSPAERHQMLAEWNDTAVPRSGGVVLQDLFKAQAARTPDAPAVVFQGEALTYAELDARAGRLARRLRRLGCGAESRVGIALERSLDLIVALLGVLEAGAAYVPLDPDYPRERLAFVLEDAAPRVLITQTGLRDALPAAPGTAVLDLDAEEIAGGPLGPVPVDGRQLAYVLYTSGSTGRPKGVGVPHEALVNFLGSMRRTPGFSPGERLLAVTSLSFDIAALEIFLPLIVGGCVELATRAEAADAALLAARLRASGATVLQATPATWRMLLDAGWAGDPHLRALCGGEGLPRDLAASLAGRTRELWNLYGPTETTVWSAAARVLPGETGPVSIGRPIADTQIHLLDRQLQPVPLGAPGELWIGGAGLSRGYLGRPDLTAERFLPNPFEELGGRLYRTGDLARHLPGGRMEVLGRIDHQVKVRGFRIELGEIEAVLAALPGVRQAVVVASAGSTGDRRLVAYVVGTGAKSDLLQGLRERLPEYMVPSALVTLPALPLTPNGKVDRKALPAPDLEGSEEGYLAPRTAVEEILAGIWAEVLGRDRVGVTDHFFDLGGHSLLATRVMSRLRGTLGVEVPLRELFAAPRLVDFAARVDAARRTGAAASAPPLVPVPREGALPLSFAQQRLWFIDQLEPGSPLYNMPGALRADGPLDGAVLARCLGEIVRRHEALRTVFAAPEGSPVQVIQPAEPFLLPVVDLSDLPESAREALAVTLTGEEAARPFALTRGPLLRGTLLRLGERDHVVLLNVHHIVSDGWSMGILVREIAALYPAFAEGRPSPLPELPVQYADFAVWQRSWLQGEVLEGEIDFWRRQLAGLPSLLELPTDRPRPAVQSYGGATRPVRLPETLTQQIEALGRREGATLFMTLLAAFQTLLALYSGQDDLAVGTPVAGRNRVETEGLIGLFVNTLVLRGDLAGGPTFRELLGRVRETSLAAYLHQDVPFERLVEELAPERSLAQTPLFQVMFELQNVPTGSLELEAVHLRPVVDTVATAKFDLTLALEERGGGLGGTMEHASDLFDAATIDRLTGHFERLLAAAAAEPDLRVFDLPIASAAESAQILREWNDTRAEGLAEEGRLHLEVAAQAARTPDAVAVETESERWTYRRLVGSARRLARHLRALGVGPDAIVGLCTERSPAMVVGMLAVLEAGGAWLPLDPGLPAERLAFMLDDAGARVLLIQEPLRERVPATGRNVVLLDEARWDAGEDMGQPLEAGVAPYNLAYVIYTSGSTGQPKGVMVPHRGICNRLLWAKQVYGLGERDVFLQKAALGFDVSVWECFSPLTSGARLVLAAPGRQGDASYLVRAVREHGITHIDFVPAMLAAFLAEEDVETCVSLRQIFSGGEALTPELRDRALARLPALLDNTYGPTEVSIDTTRWVCAPGQEPHRVPIGRPIGNSRLYVVDPELRPLPVGVAGELLVGGAGVSRGYLRRPGLTAERFVPDPFGGQPGERLYRTGDRVCWLPDGSLDFLGRLDHQVKLRGVRIELGEIESALAALPGVRDAVVLVRESRLVAYVVGDADLTAEDLRRSLRERLPDYMVPSAFVRLAALPLTPNGKVDRKALPAPEQPGAREDYVAPRTREEEILAAVWVQVLRLPRVGVNDNFFELGGDSILSVQIVARARQAGLSFTVKQIFEHQTVAELARHASATEAAGDFRAGQGPVTGEVPLTPIQSWFFGQGFADPHHFNQALLLEPREPLSPAALERAMAAVVEHHDALRMRFALETGGRRQENAESEPVTPFHQVDLSGLPASRVGEACEQAAASLQAGFDLSAGPLTRLCLFDGGAGEPSRLLWVTHHLVVDGVSWRVLLEDFEAAYRRAPLPPKTTSFQEWARRLAGHAEAPAGELDYWRETVRVPMPPLPVDFPSGITSEDGNLVGDEATVAFELGAEETTDLLQTLPSVYHSRVDDALLSALVRALTDWTGSPRLRVDLEGHGREPLFDDLDVSRTVGWFTSMYPVVLEAGDAGPGEALVSAKERLRAVPGRGIGYGLLRAARLLEEAPPAEISFNYLGQADATAGELSLFQVSTTSTGPAQSPRAHRTHLLEVGGIVADGRLRITLTYGSRIHRRETAERLAEAYAGALRQLIQHGRESEEVFTPSDFPKAGLDVHGFDKLVSLLPDLKHVDDIYPLTPLQSGMLFHSLMAPESGVYVTQVTCTLPEDLDRGLFRRAWERLVERHGVLRTAFLWEGLDESRQVVRKQVSLPWRELDWRGLPAEERELRCEELRHRERHTPLPLDSAPLMRFSLIRLGGEIRFIWTSHHLLLDGWSLPLLVQELGTVYVALREEREPALPPARPFSDYVVWQQKQDMGKAEPFWREELAGFTAPNSLGILGVEHPAARASGYAEHGIRLSREVTAELQALAARHKLTLQTVTLGAWAVLVGRYSGDEDVVFGGVVSGRPAALPGVETMVGMFVNSLPVRARVDGAEPVAPWLRRLQERQLARQDFEHTPLAQIQRWSDVPAGSPLFETLYVFENYPDAGGSGSGSLGLRNLRSFESTNYPVTLTLTAADQVSLHLATDRARVDGDAAPRLLQHLATLLAGLAEETEADLPLEALPLLSKAERQQLLEWGGIREEFAPLSTLSTLHGRFAAQARRSPDAAALTCGDVTLSYGELHRRSNQLAHSLRRQGAGPESRIGLRLDRSVDLVVGILGVLEAGAAYVPLDPDSPRERQAFVLEDAGIQIVVGAEELALTESLPAGDLEPLGDETSLAYVIYTSGSTGRPKGTLIPHGNVTRLFDATEGWFGFGARDVWTLFHSYTFDFSVWEIWGALLYGGRLVVVPWEVSRSPELFLDLLVRERVTVLNQTPSAFAQLAQVDEQRGAVSTDLRLVIFGGEALDPASLEPWFERHGDTRPRLVNMYGITETTVHVTYRPLSALSPAGAPGEHRSVIGVPIADLSLAVMDRSLRPVPIGVPGELVVGGAGLARGYLGRPGLTAERFVPDPTGRRGDRPGERLYRSGDLGRYLPNGDVEYLGRLDHQVKVRGFRIELGEIEAALSALPGVRQAVVLAREGSDRSGRSDRSVGSSSDRWLVAYVVGDVSVAELRQSLRERLPDYMVPAAFVPLAALPLTVNGKVDRKALPAPEQSGASEGYVAPRTREEEILATVWAQVLRLSRVGVNDNFFELGGDSILSVQIVARARQAGLLFGVRQIFEHQTVAELARHATAAEAGAVHAKQGPVTGEVPLTPIQSWFFEQGFADLHHYNQALLLEPREPLSPAALERAMATLVEHHDALRMRFEGRRQENAASEPVTPFHQVDLSGLPAPRRGEACEPAAAALQAGFDLSTGPLTRLCLFNGGDEPSRLLWATHHLVVDGVSWRVLLEDLEAAYRQAALPPKTTSFQEWARRLAGHAEALAGELEHWRETVRVPVPRLPVDFPEAGNLVGDEATVSFELSAEETAGLLQTLPSVYHSRIDDALLSALARALAGWTGSPRLRVDLEGHGREPLFDDLDVSRTVGWFTSIYPVVLEAGDAGPDADAGRALVSAKERLRAVPGRGIGYGLLRAARLLEEAPAAEVLFNYLGQADATADALSLFRASTTSTGPCRSPRAHRTHLLEVSGMVEGGRLQISLTYGSRTHRRETVERLAEAYAGALRQLLQQARESEEVFTPSDFPKARLDAHAFQQLVALLPDLKEVDDLYPLTPLQSGMLFHSLMSPESGVYVTQVTCTLPADLDARLFRQAWERLVERHTVLRTAFLWEGLDEPRQVVRKRCALPWQDLDWRGLSAEEQRRRFEALRHDDRHAPIPLDSAPLMRFSLIRLDGELRFIWTSHHLLLDGWSLPLLVQELGAVYPALREGGEPVLPPARPFSDYVVWLQRQDMSRAESFWREELAGFTAPSSLGILGVDHPAARAAGYDEHEIQLSREVTAELQALAARHKLTLQTVTLGAWAALVSRYGGGEDVVFGGVVSGRPAALPGVETMVGMFVNSLPVRVRVDGTELLAPWLQRLQERQLARQELEHTPLAQIQKWSEVPAGSPLFETLYVFENYPDADGAGSGGLGIRDLRSFESTNYPVTLVLTAADQVSLHLATDRARVDGDAAPRLLQHLATLLAGMAAGMGERPERRVGELDLLTAAERRQILGEWNDTRVDGLAEGCLHHAVALQAARTPSAVAVELGNEQWTYRRLVSSARLLARHLRELGVGPDRGPDEIVGLCADRSPAMVVGMLAILEAGGAYLPLDPTYPPERLAFMLEDSGARVLLLQEHLRERVETAADGLQVVPLDARWSSDEEMAEPLGVEVTPDHLAYVIYTSGSTGRPKGVMVPHGGICNRLGWAQQLYRLDERDAVLQKASFGFDFSVWECFAPLWAGARLVLAEPGRQADVPYLLRVLREHRVTIAHFVPSMLAAFLAEEGVETCTSLRQVFSGGEALTPELRDRALARLPAAFDNEYGPTETCVDSTRWACAPGQDPRRVPIGRPISNTQAYVVDPELRPVPVGVAGELLVGGAGVTRGYLRRPGLTAERFIPDPFGDVSGGRLYRTGDLVRWLPDGAIDYLGRLDHQVKVRGLRIELGEIEAALVALPGIRQAAVVVRESRLVAYVVGHAGDVRVDEARRSLRERLPDYMVPALFVTLPALPLTASGKVDRKALPAPEQPGAREEGYVAPRTREEEVLAAVWAQVLRLPRVGVNDNFFELGGDSILSIQIVARARQAGLLFTVREVFEHQTVAGLALHVTLTDAAGAALPGQGPVTGEVPLTPIQSRFFDLGIADPHHFNQALLLEPREPLSAAALDRAMAAIVEHHDALRMRFVLEAGGRRQENAPAEPAVPFHQVDLSGLPASRRGEAYEPAAAALQAGFDLSAGPLTRLCLFEAGSEPSRLLWVTHHLVVDGVSWRVLLEDFEAAYRQAALPPKTTSFQEWARRLTGHAEALAGELDYWRETARVPVPRLPVDFPAPGTAGGNLNGDEATVNFELGAEETADLLQTLPSVYHSRIDDALLSALVRALKDWTGSSRLRVDLEGHGREPLFDDLDVSRTVGWFTSMYPVVLEAGDAGPDADPGRALVSVKEKLRAVPGRGIGYGLLRAARLLEEAPPAEVLFNYLGQADATSGELSLFRASTASTGPCRSLRAHRTHLLEVTGIVTDGRLQVTLTYGSRTHRRETVERLAASYAGALRQLIQHSRESEEVFTPSDFPKARLDARSFDKLAALLADDD